MIEESPLPEPQGNHPLLEPSVGSHRGQRQCCGMWVQGAPPHRGRREERRRGRLSPSEGAGRTPEGVSFRLPQPAPASAGMGRGTSGCGSLAERRCPHSRDSGALSVQGSHAEHASLRKGDSGLWLWGLSQPGRTPGGGRGFGSPQSHGELGGPQV